MTTTSTRTRTIASAVRGAVTGAFLLAMLAALGALVVVPKAAGATPYTVLSGSMEPSISPGDVVVVRPVEFDAIRTGDVITYQLESGNPMLVTHRVIGAVNMPHGETRYVTQGDANNIADREPVREVQMRGRVWYAVPRIGYVNAWLTGRTRTIVVYGVSSVLLTYALVLFATSFRRPGNRRPHDRSTTGDDINDTDGRAVLEES